MNLTFNVLYSNEYNNINQQRRQNKSTQQQGARTTLPMPTNIDALLQIQQQQQQDNRHNNKIQKLRTTST